MMREYAMKRFISVFLSAFLILSLVVTGVNALSPSYEVSESYKSGDYYTQLTAVELTGNYIDDLINVALSQKNYHEGAGNSDLSGFGTGHADCTEYCRWYGYNVGWCAVFISWCARQAQIPESIISNNSWADGCGGNFGETEIYSFSEHEPQKGDIIYISNDSDPEADHVGLVYEVDDEFIYALEGNTSDRVYDIKYYKDSGRQFYYNDTVIVYYGVPDYGQNGIKHDDKPEFAPGDVNGDGYVSSVDALTVLRYAVGMETISPEEAKRADIDSNGAVNSYDALEILTIATK